MALAEEERVGHEPLRHTRIGDEQEPGARYALQIQSSTDGDVFASIVSPDDPNFRTQVEFCAPRGGGKRIDLLPKFWNLREALKKDNERTSQVNLVRDFLEVTVEMEGDMPKEFLGIVINGFMAQVYLYGRTPRNELVRAGTTFRSDKSPDTCKALADLAQYAIQEGYNTKRGLR